MIEQHVFEIATGIISLLLGGMMKLFWDRLRRIEGEVRDVQKEQGCMKTNYVERFEGLSQQLADFRVEVVGALGEIKVSMASRRKR
jgi:hypothetical protein